MTLARFHIPGSLVLVALLVGCDRPTPFTPRIEAAAASPPGSTVNAPSGTNAVAASKSQIDVTWRDNSTNETGFELHRSTAGPGGAFTALATTGASVTNASDRGLTSLTQYCYKVRAFKTTGSNTSYSTFSTTACATTPGPPAAPSSADATALSSSAVGITWVDNSGTEDGFRVERAASTAGPWETAATTGPNVTSYSDGGRTSEQQVCYRMIAFNALGNSAASNSDCTTPLAGPSDLTAVTGVRGIDLAWADRSAIEYGYVLHRATDGVTFSAVAYLPANSSSFHDGTALSNTTYSYRVQAKRNGEFSDPSNVASAEGSCAPTSEVCDNGLDDDCDGRIDGADTDCQSPGYDNCPCGGGYMCSYDLFCVPHCNDGAHDGDETDVDCGGPSCNARCQAGQACSLDSDCASGICAGTCQ